MAVFEDRLVPPGKTVDVLEDRFVPTGKTVDVFEDRFVPPGKTVDVFDGRSKPSSMPVKLLEDRATPLRTTGDGVDANDDNDAERRRRDVLIQRADADLLRNGRGEWTPCLQTCADGDNRQDVRWQLGSTRHQRKRGEMYVPASSAGGAVLDDARLPLRDPAPQTLAPNGGAAPARAADELSARVEHTFTSFEELYDNVERRHPGVIEKRHGGTSTYDIDFDSGDHALRVDGRRLEHEVIGGQLRVGARVAV